MGEMADDAVNRFMDGDETGDHGWFTGRRGNRMPRDYHHGMAYDDDLDDQEDPPEPRTPRCKHCGSTDVRWRQQTGRWVLFSLEPGKLHVCGLDDSAFEVVK